MRITSFAEVPPQVGKVVLGAGPLAAGLGFYEVAIAVFLPLEGVSITNVGAILTTFGLAAVICSIPFSILSDRYGRKLMMLTGALLSIPVTIIPGLTSDFLILEISAFAGGVADAMYISTWNAYLADATPEECCSLVDKVVARQLAQGLSTADFSPLPVLGVPGWWEGQDQEFYKDVSVFRPKRKTG